MNQQPTTNNQQPTTNNKIIIYTSTLFKVVKPLFSINKIKQLFLSDIIYLYFLILLQVKNIEYLFNISFKHNYCLYNFKVKPYNSFLGIYYETIKNTIR